ncbi:hypothetical protein [Pinirhizobacter sp.]|jgi:transcriptional regulator with GAF, ATPase, and Fis domain|uniref:hypothetical protein n=1 Tax=Pinirhizobacter sp. TaxID=2950432 RepID=UPI002F3E91B1
MSIVSVATGYASAPATATVYTNALARKVSEGRFDGNVRSVSNVLTRIKVFVTEGSRAAAIVRAMQTGDKTKLGAFRAAANEKRGDVAARLARATEQKKEDRLELYRINRAYSKSPGLSREASKGAARQMEERNDARNDLYMSTSKVDRLDQKLSRCDARDSLIQACLEKVSNQTRTP